jgi:aconitate hydratase
LTGEEVFEIEGIESALRGGTGRGATVKVRAKKGDGAPIEFDAKVRIDTPQEALYYEHGGILPYVLRQLLAHG